MTGREERERLMERYRDHPAYRAAAVVKCGACLGVVSMIAFTGAHEPGSEFAGAALASHASASASIQHSRVLREQRIATYSARHAVTASSERATVAAACAAHRATALHGEAPRVVAAACVD
jgi:hypothetical protein